MQPWLVAEGLMLLLVLAVVLRAISRRLHPQNALLACAISLCSGVFLVLLQMALNSPRAEPPATLGLYALGWTVSLLCGRETARALLRPFRSRPAYGYYQLALAGALTLLFDLSLRLLLKPQFGGWAAGLGWGLLLRVMAAVLTLALLTPALINKRDRPQ